MSKRSELVGIGDKYQITVEDENGVDIVGFDDPMTAVNVIMDAQAAGADVTYTGDPFADFARLALADEE